MNWKIICWLLLATILLEECVAGGKKKDKKDKKSDKKQDKNGKKKKDKDNKKKGKPGKEGPGALEEYPGALEEFPGALEILPGVIPQAPKEPRPVPKPKPVIPPRPGPVIPGSGFVPPRPDPVPDIPPQNELPARPHLPPFKPTSIERFNAVLQVMKSTKELLGEDLARAMFCTPGYGSNILQDFENSLNADKEEGRVWDSNVWPDKASQIENMLHSEETFPGAIGIDQIPTDREMDTPMDQPLAFPMRTKRKRRSSIQYPGSGGPSNKPSSGGASDTVLNVAIQTYMDTLLDLYCEEDQ